MILNNADIDIVSAVKLFKEYEISEEDLVFYLDLIEQGEVQQALDIFIDKYFVEPSYAYSIAMGRYLEHYEKGEIKQAQKRKIEKSVALLSFALVLMLKDNFKQLIDKIVGPRTFDLRSIKNAKVKQTIIDATLGQFNEQIDRTLIGTQARVLTELRKMQKNMVMFNERTKGFSEERFKQEVSLFLSRIKKDFPEYQKMKEGKIIASNPIGLERRVRYYRLESYAEGSVRATLLNIDRNAVQIYVLNKEAERAKKKGRVAVNVVKYALVDDRPLKTGVQREICQSILSDKRYGHPILALDQQTADILGIMTVDEAMSTPDYAMAEHCRHGLLPISVNMRKKLEKVIKEALNKEAA